MKKLICCVPDSGPFLHTLAREQVAWSQIKTVLCIQHCNQPKNTAQNQGYQTSSASAQAVSDQGIEDGAGQNAAMVMRLPARTIMGSRMAELARATRVRERDAEIWVRATRVARQI